MRRSYDFDHNGHLVPLSPTPQVIHFPKAKKNQERHWRPCVSPQEIVQDPSRDTLLTSFGQATLKDRYLLPGESFQDMFARVSAAFADNVDHAQRLYDYMSQLWFMPATPILSNGGAKRGLPISCFLNSVDDTLEGIVSTWTENVALASLGGGDWHLLGIRTLHWRKG